MHRFILILITYKKILQTVSIHSLQEFSWSWKRDLNTRPAHYECAALPTELFQRCYNIILQMNNIVKPFGIIFIILFSDIICNRTVNFFAKEMFLFTQLPICAILNISIMRKEYENENLCRKTRSDRVEP